MVTKSIRSIGIFSVIIFSCFFVYTFINPQNLKWKYGGGLYIGDWIDFENGMYTISNDTINVNEKPVAIIDDFGRRILSRDCLLEIRGISNNEIGTYVSK